MYPFKLKYEAEPENGRVLQANSSTGIINKRALSDQVAKKADKYIHVLHYLPLSKMKDGGNFVVWQND
jgi:hypothetical protein